MPFTIFISLTLTHNFKHEREETPNEENIKQGLLTLAKISFHEVPMKTQDINSKYIIKK